MIAEFNRLQLCTEPLELAICDYNENFVDMFKNGRIKEPLPLNDEGLEKQPIGSRRFGSCTSKVEWTNYCDFVRYIDTLVFLVMGM